MRAKLNALIVSAICYAFDVATQNLRVRLSSQESGQVLVLTALSMVALLGVAALSLDASFMFAKRNQLHAAADAAAKSAAVEIVRNPGVTLESLERFADQQVAAHGFAPSRLGGTTTVIVNRGPASGAFAGNSSYVEAIVSEATSTFFGKMFGFLSMTPGAIAVAGAGNPSVCIIVLEDMTIGNTEITLNGCGVAVGDELRGNNPNSEINGTPLPSVGAGSCSGTCSGMGSLTTGALPPIDPLAGLVPPTNPGGCRAGATATLSPGCYTSITPAVTTLNPGIYYVTGTVNIGNLTGNNVMIYLTGAGRITSGNNQRLRLTAPTSGPYTGIAIFQDPTNNNNFTTGNHFTLDVQGAIYMPGTDVDIANHLTFSTGNCTLFIARSLSIRNGSGAVSGNGCASAFGGAAFLTASIAQ